MMNEKALKSLLHENWSMTEGQCETWQVTNSLGSVTDQKWVMNSSDLTNRFEMFVKTVMILMLLVALGECHFSHSFADSDSENVKVS